MRKVSALLVLALLVSLTFTNIATLVEASSNQTKVALVKLWEISHTTYMAKFIGEDYVAVFEGHGDVSLDWKYIGTVYSGRNVWIYKISTGELIAQLTTDTDDSWGDTWEVKSWEPFQAVKVWDRFGFFSADSKRMIEDVRFVGTDARVVDTTSWTTIPIDWGFTDTDGTHFYAVQLDYSGSTLVVGYIYASKLLVFKYDSAQGKYVKVFEHTESGYYGRRLQMTLDGNIILVGGIDYGYLDIFKYDKSVGNYTRVVHYELPDAGGLGALGISDPSNVGYIIGGTKNGWVVIAHYDPDTDEFKVIYQNKEAPDDSWLYNPFYERWIPKVTEVFALCSHRDSSRPGYGIVYDVVTNQTIVIHFADAGTPSWKAAAVSPGANYVFIGNALYMVVRRDPQSGNPRVRLWGTFAYNRFLQDLSAKVVFKPPNADWHLYFMSGRVTVSKIYTQSIPVTLTNDPDILMGKLGRLYSRGLVTAVKLVENSGYVSELDLSPQEMPGTGFTVDQCVVMSSLYVVQSLYGWDGHGFGGATVSSGTIITIPLSAPVNVYSDIRLSQSIAVVTVAPIFDWKKELLGVAGIPLLAGVSYATGKALASRAAQIAVAKAVAWGIARTGTTIDAVTAVSAAKSALAIGSKLLTVVGVGLIVDAGLGIVSKYVTYSSVRSFILVMPIVEDSAGNKYSAVVLVLPLDEISNYAGEYSDHVSKLKNILGLKDVGIVFVEHGKTWKEYKALLEAGRLPTIDLKSAIETTIATKYGLSMDELKITSVKIVVETLIHGWSNLWDYVWGGLKVPVITVMAGSSIQPKATVAGGKVYTDPSIIASLLESVKINGVEYALTAGIEGAYADFSLNGSQQLVIEFGKSGYFGTITVSADVLVKKEFTKLGDYGYECVFHYDWKDVLIRLTRVEFVDMPYPLVFAERMFIYKYGNFTHDITAAMNLNSTTDDPNSPTGKRYVYVTVKNTKFLDPANGAMLQPCKKFIFRYYYRTPPDVSLLLYLNGTSLTSTLAQHATVVLNSTAEQDVSFMVVFSLKKLENLREVTLLTESFTDTVHLEANATALKAFNISSYVSQAIELMKKEGVPVFLEITAKIVSAEYDYIKSNNERTVVYYPPFGLVQLYGQNCTLTILAVDSLTGDPVSGVAVKIYNDTLSYEGVTNASGYVEFNVTVGLWNINASKDGYHTYLAQIYVYGNMSYTVWLVNSTAYIPPGVTTPLNNTNPPITYNNVSYWWLSVQVVWKDGMPFHGALVTVRDNNAGTILFQQETNGTGFVHFLIQNSTEVKVEVNATNPLNTTQTFYEYRIFNLTHHTWLVFRLPWESEYHQPEVMLTGVAVVIHRGQGYYFGNVSHLVMTWIWTNTPQTIEVTLTLYDVGTNETIASKVLTLELEEGLNINMTWFDINASQGAYIRVHAKITAYENDTDTMNNELWSDIVFLKPMVDIQVFVVWKPVEQKVATAILPGDTIEVCIGVYIPINTTIKPMMFDWQICEHEIRKYRLEKISGKLEEVKTITSGIIWRNITVTVPWTDKVVVLVNASHEWEDFGYNNYINVTIPVDPDVAVEKVKVEGGVVGYIMEGSPLTIKVYLKSNVPVNRYATGFLSLYDNVTQTLIKRMALRLRPDISLKVTVQAPENPPVATLIIPLKTPITEHIVTAMFSGYDLYEGNNQQTLKFKVYSNQLQLLGIAVGAFLITVIALAVLVKAAKAATPAKPRKYIRIGK